MILYDANESTSGSVPVDSNTYEPGKIVTVLGNTGGLAKTGYLFKGWTLSASGNGVLYPAGSAFLMGRKNLTLYAKWALPPGGAVWGQGSLRQRRIDVLIRRCGFRWERVRRGLSNRKRSLFLRHRRSLHGWVCGRRERGPS